MLPSHFCLRQRKVDESDLTIRLDICHNFTKIGVGHQGLPDPYSSASVSCDEGWQSLPLGILALLAGPIDLMVTQTTEVDKNKNWIAKGTDQE